MRPDDLNQLLRASESYYSRMHSQMRRADALYNREYAGIVDIPENVPFHKSSTPTLHVDELRDQIRTDEPTVKARTKGASVEAGNLQATQQMWGKGVIEQAAEEGLVDPFGQAAMDLLLRGSGCLKWMVKREILEPEPGRWQGESGEEYKERLEDWRTGRADSMPFVVKAVDPLNLYPSPGPGRLRYMIEVQERRVMDMWEQYPGWSDPKVKRLSARQKTNPLRPVKWVEWWSWVPNPKKEMWEGYYIVEADGERIIDMANPYGQVPYDWRYSGLGRVNHDGDPKYLAIGLLDQIDGEIVEEVKLKTAMSAQWQFHVFPRLMVKGVEAADVAKMLGVGPGAVLWLPQQGEAEWMEVAPPSPTMHAFLEKIGENLSKKVSPALSGQKTADFGIHQALQIGQAVKVVGRPKAALNTMTSKALEGMAALMHRFDIKMNVHGTLNEVEIERMVTGKDFKHRSFEVKFEATDPTENDRAMLAGLAVKRDEKTMSRETFRRTFLKHIVESNEEEEARIMQERIQDFLIENGLLPQIAMQELGLLRQEQQLEAAAGEAKQMAQEAVPGARERMVEGVAGGGPQLAGPRAAAQEGMQGAR